MILWGKKKKKKMVKRKPVINEKAYHVATGPIALQVNVESYSVSWHLLSAFSKVLHKRDEHRISQFAN